MTGWLWRRRAKLFAILVFNLKIHSFVLKCDSEMIATRRYMVCLSTSAGRAVALRMHRDLLTGAGSDALRKEVIPVAGAIALLFKVNIAKRIRLLYD